MAKLLMITGQGGQVTASGKKGAFYNTLEEFHKYWERIDIIAPKAQIPNSKFKIPNKLQITNSKMQIPTLFGNVYFHTSPWPLFLQPFWILKKGLEIYKEQKFDLITVHSYPPFYNDIGARMLWNKIRVSYILEIHHIPGHPKSADVKERIYKSLFKFFIKFSARKAKAVRVVNRKQVPEFLIKSGVSQEKIVYIPSMYIDLEIFQPMDLSKEYDLIFVGRLEKNKGIDLLLEAVNKIKAQIPNFKLIIVGDGPLKEVLEFKIENLKLQDNVLLHGWAKDSKEVAQLMNKSKILIMPSYNEGGPRVVLEAMACGVPVIATSVGIAPDIIKDKESGRIIDWSAEDITAKARELLSNTEEYNKYRRAGLEIAKQFEKKAAIKNYADQLRKLLNG